MSLDRPATARELIDQLLDRRYTQATAQVVRSIGDRVNSPRIRQRLDELRAEGARLAEDDQRLTTDNAVFRALLADMDTELRRIAGAVDAAGGDLQRSGMDAAGRLTRQLALPGFTDGDLARIGISWNVPDPEQIAALVDYVENPAWSAMVGEYADSTLDVIRNQIIRGQIAGWGHGRIAAEITRLVGSLPLSKAQLMMRTLQLESWRTATAAHQVANANILTEQIRVGTLDNRICMACLSLHGQRLPIGEKITDHHLGRCTSISVVRGRPRTIQTGPEWFASRPEAERRAHVLAVAGPGAWEALQRGAITLEEFRQDYTDPLFGQMVRQASLKGMLGDAASEFYQR